MRFKKLLTSIFAIILLATVSLAQTLPVVIEAESGTMGSEFRNVDTLGCNAVTVSSDIINSLNPGSVNRTVTYQVTFADTGTYDLYIKILVGKETYNDDSFLYGNGFGSKNALGDTDWYKANGLAGVGYTDLSAIVDGAGGAQSNVWKWLNLSQYKVDGTQLTFKVEAGSLTKTFQIGGRENGLYFDKFVFAKSNQLFTVDKLEKGEAGSVVIPNNPTYPNPIAFGKEKFLGSEWNYNQATNFHHYWNQVTPENAGKWGSVEGSRNSMNWTTLDSTYNVSKRYGMLFKHHTLIWGAQQPSWMATLDSANQRKEIEQWFSLLAARYPEVYMIDVVNEPIHNAPNGMLPWGSTTPNINYAKALGGAGKTGWDWIITSFKLARQYFPNAKLIINEYSVINSSSKTKQYVDIVKLLQADSLIDGIGEQAHAFTTYNTPATTLKANLDALAATGLPIYITEMDIDGATDLAQYKEMKRVFPVFWQHPAVKGITFWGFRYGLWRTDQGAYLVNQKGEERPALKWLKAYVNDSVNLAKSLTITSSTGNLAINTKGAILNMLANVLPENTTIKNVTWSVSPLSVASIDANGVLKPLTNGTATITATTWDGSNVKGTTAVTITNQNVGSAVIANAENIRVYPNPSSNGNFTIESAENLQRAEVFTLTGKKILSFDKLNQSSLMFQMDSPKGVYLLSLTYSNQSINQKIVIQ